MEAQAPSFGLLDVPVLSYIEPPRELLKTANRPNCLYKKQLNPLPFVMNCCDDLYELGFNNQGPPIAINPQQATVIYRRAVQLIVDPYQPKNYFKSTKIEPKIQQFNSHLTAKEGELTFDSNFQSGNLLEARKQAVGHRYHLMMQNDINTYGCTQWFFFKTLNKQKLKATFCINNFYKPQSLYRSGMKVLVFSKKQCIAEGTGWVRGAENISYFPNKATEKRGGLVKKRFYTLKFDFTFQQEDDEVFFAYNYPYTYSKLNTYLAEKARENNLFYNCRLMCKTIADNKVSLITITDHQVSKFHKNTVFITSRVHPGQTVSSLVMEGVIDFLTGHTPMADQLRKKFIFRLIPMLNPDGVIHGNYRTNLAGIDLNRVWNDTDKELSPQIFQLKRFILECHRQCPIIMFCDFHGHSTRKSAFMYGCDPTTKGRKKLKDNRSRLFPFMLSSENQDFRYGSCNFMVQKQKEGTARIQLWKQLKITNVYTLESSFCSSEDSEYHFRPSDYRQIGVSFCKTINEYFLNEERRQEFSEKLKVIGETPNAGLDGEETDSESDTDLFNEKMLKALKNGQHKDTLSRTINFERDEEQEETKNKKFSLPQKGPRKLFLSRAKQTVKTEESLAKKTIGSNCSPSRKTIQATMATKRIVFDTEVLKPTTKKNHNIFRKSVIQRLEHGYRGKSSIYRIKRHTGTEESSSRVLAMDTSLNYF